MSVLGESAYVRGDTAGSISKAHLGGLENAAALLSYQLFLTHKSSALLAFGVLSLLMEMSNPSFKAQDKPRPIPQHCAFNLCQQTEFRWCHSRGDMATDQLFLTAVRDGIPYGIQLYLEEVPSLKRGACRSCFNAVAVIGRREHISVSYTP